MAWDCSNCRHLTFSAVGTLKVRWKIPSLGNIRRKWNVPLDYPEDEQNVAAFTPGSKISTNSTLPPYKHGNNIRPAREMLCTS